MYESYNLEDKNLLFLMQFLYRCLFISIRQDEHKTKPFYFKKEDNEPNIIYSCFYMADDQVKKVLNYQKMGKPFLFNGFLSGNV